MIIFSLILFILMWIVLEPTNVKDKHVYRGSFVVKK